MLRLRIVTPEKIAYEGDIVSVLVPGALGQFEILNNHAPIISSLVEGDLKYTTDEGSNVMHILSGFVSVKKNEVNVCVEV